eukprot:GFYU01005653.1.p1 GENE.GFYU01005653.1~~GFYU01005653.1.p1  ORF type:complete len:205 (-),score=38.29 GFYU01005653.1:36-650(-)
MSTSGAGAPHLKVVLLGAHNVGKSSLVERFTKDNFTDNKPMTVGAAFTAKPMTVDGQTLTVGVWDTAGTERFESMARIYYRSAQCAIVCYDVANKASFDKLKFWVDELKKNEQNCVVAIAATKCDLLDDTERAVPKDDVIQYAKMLGASTTVVDTSAKSGANIDYLFHSVVQSYLQSPYYREKVELAAVDVGKVYEQPKSSSCC